jgi:PPOX class probable F420-dependent enzyme
MSILTPEQRTFLAQARTATLATVRPDGGARLVPICFALRPDDDAGRPVLYTPLDEKPKRTSDVRDLARVKDILVLPEVALLVDHWDEDWSRLAWLRLHGIGELLEPQAHEVDEHAMAVELLRAKYPQYASHALERLPMICIRVDRAQGWTATPQP